MRTALTTALAVITILCAGFAASAADPLPIIPGAHGFGMETVAGSGRHLPVPKTRVIKVTNLKDKGRGSLRYALENQPGPKVIVFEVSGYIALKRGLRLGDSRKGPQNTDCYVTIAGQTAPSPGITIRDYALEIDAECHDILIQHIRIRPGDTSVGGLLKDGCRHVKGKVFSHPLVNKPNVGWGKGIGVTWNGATLTQSKSLPPNSWYWRNETLFVNVGGDPAKGELIWLPSKTGISDPLELEGSKGKGPRDIVIDHCSFSWGGDMNVKTNANNLTFTNNISSEALHHPRHPKGPHSKGFLVEANHGPDTAHNTFFARNLLAHNVDRNPRHANNEMVIINNLIYDVRFGPQVEDGRRKTGRLLSTVIGNYIIETKTTRYSLGIFFGMKPESRIYFGPDNFYSGKVQTDPWNSEKTTKLVLQRRFGGKYADTEVPLANRADKPPVWVEGYKVLPVLEVREHVLANAGARPADRDAVDRRVVDQVRNDTKQAGGIIASQVDVGGWPELAENRRELQVPENPNGDNDGDGYTNLEEWLHAFAAEVERKKK